MPVSELRLESLTHGDIRLRFAVQGSGPLVIMCHGFPGLWQSWSQQLAPIADAGFTALALDMRGYGGSSQPFDVADYRLDNICEDLIALLEHFGQGSAIFIGTDFGAAVLWHLCRAHPKRVRAMIVLSVPFDFDYYGYMGQGKQLPPPTQRFEAIAQHRFLHAHYFQTPGIAEASIDPQPREFLTRLFWALSANGSLVECMNRSQPGMDYIDVLEPAPQRFPWYWFSKTLMDDFEESFQRTGFRGALNWYRACDLSWELNGKYIGQPIHQPCLFIAGKQDPVITMSGEAALDPMKKTLKDLRGLELIDQAGHFVQMEQADKVNGYILQFLNRLND